MNPQATLTLSDKAVKLSDALTATVTVDGPTPLAVTPPLPLLNEISRQCWLIKPAGQASVTKLSDGRERWTQHYRLEPFVPGDAIPVDFAVFEVASGAGAPVAVMLPKQTVAVARSLAADANDPRPITGPEILPPLPNVETNWVTPTLVIVFSATAILAAILLRMRRLRPAPVAVDPLAALEMLGNEIDVRRFADSLSNIVRASEEARTGQPVTRQTTAEIAPDSSLAAILIRCDAVKFAGEELSEADRAELLAAAQTLVAAGQSPAAA